ncbi:hypothetical protein JQ504_13140 [Klebsiella pneumoniae]|nr:MULTISPECIES: hypothetical protein [Enterobacteriaceae]EIW8703762.1 hypothetical protein [Klebsiella pneumoniae]EKJ7312554.1 hypothetical protein [Klebsiella pneumoniae]EKP7278691.1 hypothetical protein [Klebsiella pneumoniae]EKW0388685.1 hypothetical protein [Klebsiella pneumoniae]EKZ9794983.1 hypothetical protein [Klebsiella pneumoniae]
MMEDLNARLEELEDKVLDLNVSMVAHKSMIKALLQFIELKHGATVKNAISKGLLEAIEDNTIQGDTPEAISSQLLTEKLREFV